MSRKLKKLAAMMMALMMIALVGITASAQIEETEEQLIVRIAPAGALEEDENQDEEQGFLNFLGKVNNGINKVKNGINKVKNGISKVSIYKLFPWMPDEVIPISIPIPGMIAANFLLGHAKEWIHPSLRPEEVLDIQRR